MHRHFGNACGWAEWLRHLLRRGPRRTGCLRPVTESCEAEVWQDELPPRRQALLGNILEEFEGLYARVSAAGFAERVVDEASALSDVLGRDVIVRLAGGGSVEGHARRLTERGELEVHTADGSVTVHSGEIERLRTA